MNQNEDSIGNVAKNAYSLMVAAIAARMLQAAESEEYRDKLKRRSELREELSAPDWFPEVLKPYYNISTWKGRISFFVLELSVWSPFNWHHNRFLDRLATWSIRVDTKTRWEAHEDW